MREPNILPFLEKVHGGSSERLRSQPHVWDYVHPAAAEDSAPDVGMLVVGLSQEAFRRDIGLLGATPEAGPRRYRSMGHPALEAELVPLVPQEQVIFEAHAALADADTQAVVRAA